MKINLDEKELKEAVVLWIENEGFSLEGKQVDTDFTAGRSPVGHSADVVVTSAGLAPQVTQEVTALPEAPEEVAPAEEDDSPFIGGDTVVDGNQPALDLDMD